MFNKLSKILFASCILFIVFLANKNVYAATPVYNATNGHYYQAVSEKITWTNAKAKAEIMIHNGVKGHLATIASKDENDFIINKLGGATLLNGYWLGGFQPTGSIEPSGNWQWVTGEQWSYTNWNKVQPDDSGNTENFLHIWYSDGTWNDYPDSDSIIEGYIVEFDTPTTSDPKLKLVLEVKEEKQLSVSEELYDNADMVWTSSDTSIATIDANGKLKALKPVNTVITCTNKDGSYTEKINVLVVDLAYQLAVDLKVGDKAKLTVDSLTNAAKVTWVSNDTTISTVSGKGKVTAVSEGLTYVTATDEQGKEIGKIYIRVRK